MTHLTKRSQVEWIVQNYIQHHTPMYDHYDGESVEVWRQWGVVKVSGHVVVQALVSLRYTSDSKNEYHPNAEWSVGLLNELADQIGIHGFTVTKNEAHGQTCSLTVH